MAGRKKSGCALAGAGGSGSDSDQPPAPKGLGLAVLCEGKGLAPVLARGSAPSAWRAERFSRSRPAAPGVLSSPGAVVSARAGVWLPLQGLRPSQTLDQMSDSAVSGAIPKGCGEIGPRFPGVRRATQGIP